VGLLDRPPGMAAAGPWWVGYTIIGDNSTSATLSAASRMRRTPAGPSSTRSIRRRSGPSVHDDGARVRFSIRRERPSGSPGERDVFRAEQYPPRFDLPIPVAN
jgi:hypothetical protein